MNGDILFAETDEAILACFPVFQYLRPHLREAEFVPQVRRQQQQGYRLIFLQEGERVRSVAGFRILEFLAWGVALYIDDLATRPGEQRKGYAGRMLTWLFDHARANGCDAVHLDSGYQRHDAHRLYLQMGFELNSHHFAKKLNQ
jgi:GNAT superfamily N-acetyltransferase